MRCVVQLVVNNEPLYALTKHAGRGDYYHGYVGGTKNLQKARVFTTRSAAANSDAARSGKGLIVDVKVELA